jgi:transposase
VAWLLGKYILNWSRTTGFHAKIVQYELGGIAHVLGHTAVRLPPYHCQYNSIKLVWSQEKREVAGKNITSGFEMLKF